MQGEERAALNRASFDSAPELKLGPSDLIMFSAKVINAEYTAAYCTITPSWLMHTSSHSPKTFVRLTTQAGQHISLDTLMCLSCLSGAGALVWG